MKPQEDFVLANLRAIALKGGEHGPLYDQGVLSIIRQIDETGSFVPSIAVLLIDRHNNPQIWQTCFTQEERAEAEELAQRNCWNSEQAVQYGKNAFAAQLLLKGYQRKEENI